MSDSTQFDPSKPDPMLVSYVVIILRYVLTGLAGLGLYHGVVDSSVLSIIASAVVGIGSALWAIYEMVQHKRATHQAAVASAKQGTPVQPK
jgi:hypothetical protein